MQQFNILVIPGFSTALSIFVLLNDSCISPPLFMRQNER